MDASSSFFGAVMKVGRGKDLSTRQTSFGGSRRSIYHTVQQDFRYRAQRIFALSWICCNVRVRPAIAQILCRANLRSPQNQVYKYCTCHSGSSKTHQGQDTSSIAGKVDNWDYIVPGCLTKSLDALSCAGSLRLSMCRFLVCLPYFFPLSRIISHVQIKLL